MSNEQHVLVYQAAKHRSAFAFPVLLAPLIRTTGWPTATALSAYSTGLLTSAAAASAVGRLLARYGPRPVMTTGTLVGVAALLAVAAAPTLPWFFAAWTAVGLAQAMLLYPPAFAALTRWYGPRRVRAVVRIEVANRLQRDRMALDQLVPANAVQPRAGK